MWRSSHSARPWGDPDGRLARPSARLLVLGLVAVVVGALIAALLTGAVRPRTIEWCAYRADGGSPVCTSFDVLRNR